VNVLKNGVEDMIRKIKKQKMPTCNECRVTYIDGSEELIQFYDHIWQADGISLMTRKGGSFTPGQLVVGEVRIPWRAIKKLEGIVPV